MLINETDILSSLTGLLIKETDTLSSITGLSDRLTKTLPVSTWQYSHHHHMPDESTVAVHFQAVVQ